MTVKGNIIRLTPARGPARRVVVLDGLLVLERIDSHVVTDADVQRWRDSDQR